MKAKKRMMWIGIGLVVVIGGFLVGRFIGVPMLSPRPDNLGWTGEFASCPDIAGMQNCVSSTADAETRFYVEPLSFSGTVDDAKNRLLDIINSMERSTVVTSTDDYIHAEFRSLMWGFIDDTEFYIDAENNLVHVRSAARLGADDVKVNYNRVKSIRAQFEA